MIQPRPQAFPQPTPDAAVAVPQIDSETICLLRCFLMPAIEAAHTWSELSEKLAQMGYGIAFRDGRMLLRNLESGAEICTGGSLGASLRDLSRRLGRPCILATADGHSGRLLV